MPVVGGRSTRLPRPGRQPERLRPGVPAHWPVGAPQFRARESLDPADDRRRLDFVIYGAAARGEALCCDATLVSPVRRDGSPQAGAPVRDGVAIARAQPRKLARYPERTRGGPRRLCVLAAEVGGCWDDESQRLVQRLVALRARRPPATLRAAA